MPSQPRAEVIKAGKSQAFTRCDLFSVDCAGEERLVANCQAVLAVAPSA